MYTSMKSRYSVFDRSPFFHFILEHYVLNIKSLIEFKYPSVVFGSSMCD